ncbi:MAG: DUF3124 domain-containing protein [Candidatus Handelsmanbacteria bacterium]|nr:DUF3124 domain-containing protein [Candidatus Handelsmanbacteria bacterium]
MNRVVVGLRGAFLLLALGGGGPLEGQRIYVPTYSSIFYLDSQQTLQLSAMLSIHNIDLEKRIDINRVDYYNTEV